MILLDTNVFYRLCEIEKDDRYDLSKLRSFIKKNECRCSWFAYFEILNSDLDFKVKIRILNYIARNKIHIESLPQINDEVNEKLSGKPRDQNYCNQLKMIYGKYVIETISYNITFFAKSYAYVSAIIFLDNYKSGVPEDRKYFRKHFQLEQKEIDKYIGKIVKKKLFDMLETDQFNAGNIQDMLLCLIANIMTYYYELMRYAKEIFEKGDDKSYYKLINKFKRLKTMLLKDPLTDKIYYDYKYLNVCEMFMEGIKRYNDQKVKTGHIKKILIGKIVDGIYFTDSLMRNEFEEKWLQKNIEALFGASAKIKPNDFIDYEKLKELFYYNDTDLLITFDDKMQKIMKDVGNNAKFKRSTELLKLFEKTE